MTWKVIVTGVGGQGVISAGILLAEAAVVFENRHAVQSQSYGAEMRGGLSRADVTVSDDPVLYPKVEQAHVLVCLHRRGLHAHLSLLRPGGILINDSTEAAVTTRVDCRQFALPIIERTQRSFGSSRSANVCALGVLIGATGIVGDAALRDAIAERFRRISPAAVTENLGAYDLGRTLYTEAAHSVSSHRGTADTPAEI